MKHGGLALIIADKLGKKGEAPAPDDDGATGKEAAMEEFGAAMTKGDFAEAASAMENFVTMCKSSKGE